MNTKLLSPFLFKIFGILLITPFVMCVVISILSSNPGVSANISFEGYAEILSNVRMLELFKISYRSIIVSIIATSTAFIISYTLIRKTSGVFAFIFLSLITIPFIINESVRVFSWQFLLSENGFFNNLLSFLTGVDVKVFNSTNNFNVYIVMIISCIPFGIFINSLTLLLLPKVYWDASKDLNLSSYCTFFKIAIPLSKISIGVSFLVAFFISFSLSAEVNYLSGDSKISVRTLITSLMSASKFEAIYALGVFITIAVVSIWAVVMLKYKTKQ